MTVKYNHSLLRLPPPLLHLVPLTLGPPSLMPQPTCLKNPCQTSWQPPPPCRRIHKQSPYLITALQYTIICWPSVKKVCEKWILKLTPQKIQQPTGAQVLTKLLSKRHSNCISRLSECVGTCENFEWLCVGCDFVQVQVRVQEVQESRKSRSRKSQSR